MERPRANQSRKKKTLTSPETGTRPLHSLKQEITSPVEKDLTTTCSIDANEPLEGTIAAVASGLRGAQPRPPMERFRPNSGLKTVSPEPKARAFHSQKRANTPVEKDPTTTSSPPEKRLAPSTRTPASEPREPTPPSTSPTGAESNGVMESTGETIEDLLEQILTEGERRESQDENDPDLPLSLPLNPITLEPYNTKEYVRRKIAGVEEHLRATCRGREVDAHYAKIAAQRAQMEEKVTEATRKAMVEEGQKALNVLMMKLKEQNEAKMAQQQMTTAQSSFNDLYAQLRGEAGRQIGQHGPGQVGPGTAQPSWIAPPLGNTKVAPASWIAQPPWMAPLPWIAQIPGIASAPTRIAQPSWIAQSPGIAPPLGSTKVVPPPWIAQPQGIAQPSETAQLPWMASSPVNTEVAPPPTKVAQPTEIAQLPGNNKIDPFIKIVAPPENTKFAPLTKIAPPPTKISPYSFPVKKLVAQHLGHSKVAQFSIVQNPVNRKIAPPSPRVAPSPSFTEITSPPPKRRLAPPPPYSRIARLLDPNCPAPVAPAELIQRRPREVNGLLAPAKIARPPSAVSGPNRAPTTTDPSPATIQKILENLESQEPDAQEPKVENQEPDVKIEDPVDRNHDQDQKPDIEEPLVHPPVVPVVPRIEIKQEVIAPMDITMIKEDPAPRAFKRLPESDRLVLPTGCGTDFSQWTPANCLEWTTKLIEDQDPTQIELLTELKLNRYGLRDLATEKDVWKEVGMPWGLFSTIRANYNKVHNVHNGYE